MKILAAVLQLSVGVRMLCHRSPGVTASLRAAGREPENPRESVTVKMLHGHFYIFQNVQLCPVTAGRDARRMNGAKGLTAGKEEPVPERITSKNAAEPPPGAGIRPGNILD